MSPYRYVTEPTEKGFRYIIYEGDREVIRSGSFQLERDAASNGEHWASDPDLEIFIQNRK